MGYFTLRPKFYEVKKINILVSAINTSSWAHVLASSARRALVAVIAGFLGCMAASHCVQVQRHTRSHIFEDNQVPVRTHTHTHTSLFAMLECTGRPVWTSSHRAIVHGYQTHTFSMEAFAVSCSRVADTKLNTGACRLMLASSTRRFAWMAPVG